jgi:hypothetical protein
MPSKSIVYELSQLPFGVIKGITPNIRRPPKKLKMFEVIKVSKV